MHKGIHNIAHLVAVALGAMVSRFVGSVCGFGWSYLSFVPGPGDHSESASDYAAEVGAVYGGVAGLVVGGLIPYFIWLGIRRRWELQSDNETESDFHQFLLNTE